jgi:hypothetical protein
MVSDVAFKCNETFSVISKVSDPPRIFSPVSEIIVDDEDITVITSNVSTGPRLLQGSNRNGHTLRG